MPFTLTSPAFNDRSTIPAKHTCDGAGVSPPLAFLDVPRTATSLALICDDPDAPRGPFVHWVLYDLATDVRQLPEAVPTFEVLRELGGARQGQNDYGRIGWGSPCPPPGAPHRYVFTLYALDATLGLKGGPTQADVARAMEGHVLARTTLTGMFGRAPR